MTGTEQCDDGNIVAGDGCGPTCQLEIGWACGTPGTPCVEICGDGIKHTTAPTYCDDAAKVSGDGCSSACGIEPGWTCTGGGPSAKDVCTEICADGKRFNSLTTYCDDGGTTPLDGCNANCEVEQGWKCVGGSTTAKDTCHEICGDGIWFPSPTYPSNLTCDDGNVVSNDGCKSDCSATEAGWNCVAGNLTSPWSCSEICGDGLEVGIEKTAGKCDNGGLAGCVSC